MKFSLMRYEAPSDSLRRIVLDQIDGAILQLARDDNLNEGIHEARKHFKRVRAVLRLSRGTLPAATYRTENQFFRDQGRILSPVRDSAVYVETIDMLRRRYGQQLSDASFFRLRQSLVEEHGSVLRAFAGDERLIPSMIERLKEARHRALDWTFRHSEFSLIANGLRRTYRRGLKEKSDAYAQPTTENFHCWRKRVKYLWHQFQILGPLWPALTKVLARECDQLADRLGEEHDLAVLQESPLVQEMERADKRSADLLFAIAARERSRLRRAATPLAERIYVESPNQFIFRMEGYWQAYRRQRPCDSIQKAQPASP
jgi:CHAD domain-containing protein